MPQTELFLTEVESVTAQEVIDAHFEADNASPAQLVVPEEELDATLELWPGTPGSRSPRPWRPGSRSQPAVFPLPSEDDPRAPKVVDGQVDRLRDARRPGRLARRRPTRSATCVRTSTRCPSDVLVGGSTAINLDTRDVTGSRPGEGDPGDPAGDLRGARAAAAGAGRAGAADRRQRALVRRHARHLGAGLRARLRLPGLRPLDLADRRSCSWWRWGSTTRSS